MAIDNVLAGVAVRDLDAAARWYEQLLGHAGHRPMKEVAEWRLPRGGCLQVFADAGRAGKSSVTLVVGNMEEQLARLEALQVPIGKTTTTEAVKTAIVSDPDGNQVVFAEPRDPSLAQ
jgi:catechol 2,3-dioxygenase-like lactoylglutathione lyase family enzyme